MSTNIEGQSISPNGSNTMLADVPGKNKRFVKLKIVSDENKR
jgi:hypothetical protein